MRSTPGYAVMLDLTVGNGVRAIIVETANRFAGDLIVQENGRRRLLRDVSAADLAERQTDIASKPRAEIAITALDYQSAACPRPGAVATTR